MFAKGFYRWLQAGKQFGSFLEFTSFEESIDAQSFPAWWGEWRSSQPGTLACWIVDALDECEPDHLGIPGRIVRGITELMESKRRYLRLILLSRERDWLGQLEQELSSCFALLEEG